MALHWIRNWRELEMGETVRTGDVMRIGLTHTGHVSYSSISPCKYDRQGERCCVGAVVDERGRWYRERKERPNDHARYGNIS